MDTRRRLSVLDDGKGSPTPDTSTRKDNPATPNFEVAGTAHYVTLLVSTTLAYN